MVDRANIGKNLFGETVNPSVLRVKGSSRKRRRPVVSPQLQDKIANFLQIMPQQYVRITLHYIF